MGTISCFFGYSLAGTSLKVKTARFLLMDGIRDKVIAKFGDILVMVSETYRLLHADTLIRKCTNNKH